MRRPHFYCFGGATVATILQCVAALAGEIGPDRIQLVVYSKTLNNSVVSALSGKANWDPADAVTVTGQLRDNGGGGCGDVGVIANADQLTVTIVNSGHARCGGQSFTVTPGTDASGNFSFSMRGGGVSFPGTVNGVTGTLGSYVKLEFQKDLDLHTVVCGDPSTYTVLSGCASAPPIYGRLASPDLNGSLTVDASDVTAFGMYLGATVTLQNGWQADYNHDGFVDAGDTAYIAGRLGKDCNSQKAGDSYDMDIRNLSDPVVQDLLVRSNTTAAGVIAIWDQEGFSYDRSLVESVLAGHQFPTASESAIWSRVKTLYR